MPRTTGSNYNLSSALGVSGVSVGIAPTGTMANNGAVTLGTALDRIYTEGLWLFYAAGAVAAGIPASASFLWTVMSSTTVGTVFNSTFAGTNVPTVGTTTAFVTTGPGAFTGATTEQGFTVPVAAGVMGAMGAIEADAQFKHPNTAGTKTARIRYSGAGGTIAVSNAPSTSTGLRLKATIANATTGAQNIVGEGLVLSSSIIVALTNSTVDTTAATTVSFSMQLQTATDWQITAFTRVKLDRSA